MPRRPNSSPQTQQLLACLLAEPTRWRHGYDLSKETGLASGTLYPILMRLAEHDLVEAQWQAPSAPGRPPRHTYRLTAKGAEFARTAAAQAGQPAALRPKPAMRVAW